MKWIVRIYALILLGYTGWRTYDFMASQLPSDQASSQVIALLFLFATEVGLVLWHEVSLNHSSTREQSYLSQALTWADLTGSLGAGVADMIMRQTFSASYQIPPLLAQLLIYGLPLVVVLNVAGVLIYLSNDSETQIERAKKELRFEVTRQAIKELRDNTGAVAEGMKKDIYRQLRDDVTGKLAKQYLKEQTPMQPTGLNIPQVSVSPGNNGHKAVNAEAVLESKNLPGGGR